MAVELVAGAKIIAKLIGTGLSVYRATRGHGKPEELEKDFKAIQDLLETSTQLTSEWTGNQTTPIQARHVALVAGAFGQAWLEHYGPRLAFERRSSLEAHREAAVRWALTELPRIGTSAAPAELQLLDRLLAGVLETPYYLALWESFTKPNLPDFKRDWPDPLIEVAGGNDRREFEARVKRAYAEALTSVAGTQVRAYLLDLASDRGRLVRELLVHDISTWGARHVFGNVAAHARLPHMSLAEMYVEPLALLKTESASDDGEMPITSLVAKMFETSPFLVVTAHFGHGKSLTARTLAWRWAKEYLDNITTPAADRALPVFIRCGEDLSGAEARLPRMTERALWRHVGRGFQLDLKDTDPAFLTPPDTQRVVFLIDGLDEFVFTEAAVVQLFDHLRGQATGRHKVIVFSRPEVLPWKRMRELAIPVLELQPFSMTGDTGGQVGEWLRNWNRHAVDRPTIHLDDVARRGVLELARTPILLFMIAETWTRVARTDSHVRQADLYEAFLSQIARGKHDDDHDKHKPIAQAAEHLQRRLVELGLIEADTSFDQAMLWALSRVAWESHCLEQREKPLTQRKVVDLLSKELKLDDEAEATNQALCDGVLLALQVDVTSSNSRILFGHRSFREFLVGRYWERALSQIAKSHSAEWRTLEANLMGGRLMGLEDRSFEFLMELLQTWGASERNTIKRWAEQVFNDERISQSDEVTGAVFHHDRRAYLREAVLAIGSCIAGSTGIEARSETVLRSLLAWFWVNGKHAIIRAPGLIHPGAKLREARLHGADLRLANLQAADLSEADWMQVNLTGAQMSRATLRGARFRASHFADAKIDHARLHGVSLLGVDLDRADFTGSEMTGSYILDCVLEGANFSGADLQGGMMNLSYARKVANLAGSELEAITEPLYGLMIRRPGIEADIFAAIFTTGVLQIIWWNGDDIVGGAGYQDQTDRAHVAQNEPADGPSVKNTEFRITVAAEAADAVIAAVSGVAGVLKVAHSTGHLRKHPLQHSLQR